MKISVAPLLTVLALGLSAAAQEIEFLQPTDGQSLTAGQNVTIQIGQPLQLSGFVNAAISFGWDPCHTGTDGTVTCPNVAAPNAGVGDVIGTFVFQPQPPLVAGMPPNENFTIAIPSFAKGTRGVLSATLFYFETADLTPEFLVANITLNAA